uniref:Uncharacterized protein n=1 Tax=uncultured bacterium CSLF43 TaxID=1091575 RepID=G4WW23_9BACT|nr:hypothetical protein [uncultured bacterium CSLF43]
MDLRAYYQELRQTMADIADEHVVVISNATSDGGKADVRTEVTRGIAARLVVERRARLATAEEAETYRSELREAKQRYEQEAAAARVQVTVISDAELRGLRERARLPKG